MCKGSAAPRLPEMLLPATLNSTATQGAGSKLNPKERTIAGLILWNRGRDVVISVAAADTTPAFWGLQRSLHFGEATRMSNPTTLNSVC